MIIYLFDLFYFIRNKFFYFINYKKNLNSDLLFLNSINNDTCSNFTPNGNILLVEMNNFHLECIDSIVYYFNMLGYKVDIMLRAEANYNNAIKMELSDILSILQSTKIQSYDFVFLNTMVLSLKLNHHIPKLVNIKSKYGILGIYHTISDIYKFNDIKNYKEKRYFSLRDLQFNKINLNGISCSKNVGIKFKRNNIATFISIGFPIYHRNFRKQLYKTIDKLLNDGIVNFKFILIGRSDFRDLKFEQYISFFKNPTNDELLNILKEYNPHYTLGIFDNFAHKHYLMDCTSGLRQFSLMYNLPFVINNNFGISFGFDNSNAIFFDNDLYNALKYAIKNINTQIYDSLKSNLLMLNEKLNKDSIFLLQSYIESLKSKEVK